MSRQSGVFSPSSLFGGRCRDDVMSFAAASLVAHVALGGQLEVSFDGVAELRGERNAIKSRSVEIVAESSVTNRARGPPGTSSIAALLAWTACVAYAGMPDGRCETITGIHDHAPRGNPPHHSHRRRHRPTPATILATLSSAHTSPDATDRRDSTLPTGKAIGSYPQAPLRSLCFRSHPLSTASSELRRSNSKAVVRKFSTGIKTPGQRSKRRPSEQLRRRR